MVALATEDKQVCVWRTGAGSGTAAGTTGAPADPGDASKATMEAAPAEAAAAASGHVLGKRELPKKPTSVLFAPVVAPRADGAAATREKTEEVVVVSDKCGDAYAAPLPDPSSALKHLLGHTAMTITAMVTLKRGQLLATADRAEHIRVSQFPRTTIVHTYLLGHQDFVSALAAVPGEGGTMLLSGGGDGRVGLWEAEAGRELAMISVRQACQDLADGDNASEGVATMDLEEEEGSKETAAAADGGGGGSGDASSCKNGDSGADSRGEGEAGSGGVTSETPKGGGGGGGGGGVPLSVSCSEDGRTVAVVVSGLEGLLLLNISHGGGGSEGAEGGAGAGASFSLTPRARLQLPSVPIQAGFLDGDLIVALPSASSADCLQAFSLRDGVGEGAVPAETGSAREKCMSINARAREQPNGGLVLQAAVPDEDATEALGGGLRKHKGTRSAGKSPDGWNNFSKSVYDRQQGWRTDGRGSSLYNYAIATSR
ncbi:tRNA (guanine-n(7)-)-methyltransferase complex subunit, putative [Ectocarpus siliculosus]|uniref:tRNA (Guanine-n(7)-)-methyltransferase complex subunit, putative n=1 Tax=Ectocarpus siliculosus TaxID=2880 RepID=D8LHJ6_ECTSI|nr:tRNA (guanine-n(7)-)-methyltransferase complex subunit, putative [Ectocarpus siliculosus]|eukprot:CBN79278.1 tRNA (guanine-n(7)-)-methyltransferase complex subunit, putative [Ectocarpus siliculosus]